MTSSQRRGQRRASNFRTQNETNRVIKLLEANGNKRIIRRKGQMGLTKHGNILTALEMRALRYRNRSKGGVDMDEVLYNEAIDETGTVETAGLSDSDEESWGDGTKYSTAAIIEREEVAGIAEEVLEVHGVAPNKKAEGVTRLLYENVDGIRNRISNNDKLDKAKELIDELGADVVAYNEHRMRMGNRENRNGMSQMFNGGEAEIRTVVGHNIHEEGGGKVQQGGTSMMLYGTLIEQYDFEASGKDEKGLGRWVHMMLRGEDGVNTRIVCGYNPCKSRKKATRSSYQQHRRYLITKEKDKTCPRVRFREDLLRQLKSWRNEGDRLIVCMDANENIYKDHIGKALTDESGLGMIEAVGNYTGEKIGATFFRGTQPIDGVWVTPEVVVTGACVMPAGYGIGDHRAFILDFLTSSLVGQTPPKIVRAAARRLNTAIPQAASNYVGRLEDLIVDHKLIERVGKAHESSKSRERLKEKLDIIDKEQEQYMKGAEKKCRRIKSGRIPFSPESSKWIRRAQVYRSALRYHAKKIRNLGNLKRAARRCGIKELTRLSLQEIRARLKVCKDKCNYFRKHGHGYRRRHLKDRLKVAREERNEEAEVRILAIIQREKDRAYWRRLNYGMKKTRGRSARIVSEASDDGAVREYEGQEGVEEAVWSSIHDHRFYTAEHAEVCKGKLRGDFGYQAVTKAAEEVLEGTYEYAQDFDESTKDIMQECARIRSNIPANSVNTVLRRKEWQQRWLKAKEKTSSSVSNLHFSHYKAGAKSEMISHLHALKTSIALRRGVSLSRWSYGLSVMLEKELGCTLLGKLRAILLMEADFNFSNKIVYGVRMLDNARKHGYAPEEIYSEKNKMADDGSLAKVLFFDIARQTRLTAGLSSVDAANCYDSVAHAIASLVFQSFGVPKEAVMSMLETIEEMKYFLRTAYGDSKNFRGSKLEVKFQGLCQGNGAAPAGWAVISIVIIGAHKRKGHGAKFVCPITRTEGELAAILFVDDTDVIHIDMNKSQSAVEVHENLQASMTSWGNLLMASGGALKPVKCFYYLISFNWNVRGKWSYAANEKDEEFAIGVPTPGGDFVGIDHLSVQEAMKTLGVYLCPTGDAAAQIKYILQKAHDWIARAKESSLRSRDIWFLVDHQLWPRLAYGLCSMEAPWKQLESALSKVWYKILPRGGVIRSAPSGLRQLSSGFFGVGCPHLGVESLIQQVAKLHTHYGCRSNMGLKLKVSLETLAVEMGVSSQPLQQSFQKYNKRVTWCWLASLWEKCSKFSVKVHVNNGGLKLPRRGDQWIMLKFATAGFNKDELERLNKVRLHQQVLFWSCVLGASGKSLDAKYMRKRELTETWSKVKFPTERPPNQDFTLWRTAVRSIVPVGGIADKLGKLMHEGYKVWDWRYDLDNERVLHLVGDKMDVYTPSNLAGTRRSANRWVRSRIGQPRVECGKVCTVREAGVAVKAVASFADAPESEILPDGLMEVLKEWGCCWMWKTLRLVGDEDWMKGAIEGGTLTAVTDGSYIKEVCPGLCSAAFILECSEKRGRIIGSFSEASPTANAYRGELMGLMAIHLILLAANKVWPDLRGSATVHSDCLGALGRIANLPPHRIPSQCRHSDILKNVLVNCSSLTFGLKYRHVKAHQDDHKEYDALGRPAQLNCLCDGMAKSVVWGLVGEEYPIQKMFPLEPIAIFIGKEKLTTDMAGELRFWVQKQIAEAVFNKLRVMSTEQFQEVAWRHVHDAVLETPRMFQIWACKQVTNIAGVNRNLAKYTKDQSSKCPSCDVEEETCHHVLCCNEEGRVKTFLGTVQMLNDWMERVGTHDTLRRCLVKYARKRGDETMSQIAWDEGIKFRKLAKSMDKIGWRRYMEGMISKEVLGIQAEFTTVGAGSMTTSNWAKGLTIKLLEITHGQWLYRNVVVHDAVGGLKAAQRKQDLQAEIERQIEQGGEGLDEQDKYLLEINLEDLENSSGEEQYYWMISIQAAREFRRLKMAEMSRTVVTREERRA